MEKLSRTEKLAAVGHLAAGVAHEINNPIGFISSNLNALKGYSQDLRSMIDCYRQLSQKLAQSIEEKQLHAELPKLVKRSMVLEKEFDIDFILDDAGELVDDCAGGASRIKAIVHEMRYFTHPETQSIEPANMVDILNRVVSDFQSKASSTISIENKVEPLPEIACNVPHIEQAMINLFQNAVDAVGAGGQITISSESDAHYIIIKISDNGHGISADHLTKVFDPFFTTKPVGEGLGLGLTTALNIIKMHNGSIEVESDPAKGTDTIVRLPV
jgi:signal transduction histidine kinase